MIKTTLIIVFLYTTNLIYSQETVATSGGEATGNGTVSYTVGQLVYTTNTSASGNVIQGIQQSIELFTLTNPDFKALTLSVATYPNPTTDYIVLDLKNTSYTDLNYTMYDIQGRIITQGKVQQEKTPIAMHNLATGTYILKVNQNNQELKTFKIIKK